VHPAYRGQGIGGRLLDWSQLAAVPLHEERYPGLPLSISGWTSAGDSGERPVRIAWFPACADLTAAGPGGPAPSGVQVAH
jgi:GNAT superfamily N-acetyltransferase